MAIEENISPIKEKIIKILDPYLSFIIPPAKAPIKAVTFIIIESIKTGEGFQRDLITKEILWEDGFIKPPEGPGLGIELNEVVAKSNPYKLDKLHLEMSKEMIMYNKENKFAGG